MRPLEGITVLDLSTYAAGPITAMYLGDLGAEVIKVERPDVPDPMRHFYPRGSVPDDVSADGRSPWFCSLNRNKDCITLDISDEEGRRVLDDLVADVDVFIESLRPGGPERLDIEYDALNAINPDLIYCSIKGFATGSEYENLSSIDMIAQAMGGIIGLTKDEATGDPLINGALIGDFNTPMYAVQAILATLYKREVGGGGGEFLEVSMLNSTVAHNGIRIAESILQEEPHPGRGKEHDSIAPCKIFETKDSHILVAVIQGTNDMWERFCTMIDRKDLVDDTRFDTMEKRVNNKAALYEIIDQEFLKKTRDEWFALCRELNLPAAPVYNTLEVASDPYVDEQELLIEHPEVDGDVKTVRYPVDFSSTELEYSEPQRQGETTRRHLRAIGLDDEEIDDLRDANVI